MNIEQILQKNPAPWRYIANGGLINMIDGLGQQVELFTLLDFSILMTAQIANGRTPAPTSA
jgi:hypothetical protein